MNILNSIGSYFQKLPGSFQLGVSGSILTVTGNVELYAYSGSTYEQTLPPQNGIITLGTGSIGTIPKFITQYELGDSLISETGTIVTVNGSGYFTNDVTASNFTGSFYGDGTNLTGVTSYTDADTLDYINSIFVVSGSSQISYPNISNIPAGIVSGSSQLTTEFDTRYLNTNGDNVVSGSSQISYPLISNIPSGIVSGSSQISYPLISNIPSGIVSGSSQIVNILDSLNTYTASNDSVITGLNTFTSSIQSEVDGLSSTTSSYLLNTTDTLDGDLTVTGIVTATGGNSTNWNTAYGWGDHSTEGYLTSYDITTQTDPKYLRSDDFDQKSVGNLQFFDNVDLIFGNGNDFRFRHDGTNSILQLDNGDFFIRDGVTTRFTFGRTNGDLTLAAGSLNLTAGSVYASSGSVTAGQAIIKTYFNNGDLAQFVNNSLLTNSSEYGILQSSTGTMYYGGLSHNFENGNVIITNDLTAKSFYKENVTDFSGALLYPDGGYFRTNVAVQTGAIKISLPVAVSDVAVSDMISFEVKIFDYNTNESVKLFISGYNYQALTGTTWLNVTTNIIKTHANTNDYTVRFGDDGVRKCIWIGQTNSTFSYLQVQVMNVTVGFNGGIKDYSDDWIVTANETSFGTVALTNTPTLSATHLEGLSSGQFLRSDSDDETGSSIKTWFGGVITGQGASGARVQINGLQRTGNIYLHSGGSVPTSARAADFLSNTDSGNLIWNKNGTGAGTVWHSLNDGSGSTLDADLLDGVEGSGYMLKRYSSPTDGSATKATYRGLPIGTDVFAYPSSTDAPTTSAYLINRIWARDVFSGGGYLAMRATNTGGLWFGNDLDGTGGINSITWSEVLTSSSSSIDDKYLRSDVADTKTSGNLTFNNNVRLEFGSPRASSIFSNGSNTYYDLDIGDFYIRDINGATTTRFTFGRTTGDLTATGKGLFTKGITSAAAPANANDIYTTYELGTIFNGSNSTNSINYPTEFGNMIGTVGISAGRSFMFYRTNNTPDVYAGTWNGTAWAYGKILTDANATTELTDLDKFLRSDVAATKTSGNLTFNNNVVARFGTTYNSDMDLYHTGNNGYLDVRAGNFTIRDATTTRFTFGRTTGDLTLNTGSLILDTNGEYLYGSLLSGTNTRIHGINASDIEYIGSIDENVINTIVGTTTDKMEIRTNSTTAIYIDANQNIGIGDAPAPECKFHVKDSSTGLGGIAGNNQLLRTFQSRGGVSNELYNRIWALRDATGTGWSTWRQHDAISVDGVATIPGTDTRTFWERDPLANFQYFGSQANYTLTVDSANNRIGINEITPLKEIQITGGNDIGIRLYNNLSNYWEITNGTNGVLNFIRGGTNYFNIDQLGDSTFNGDVNLSSTNALELGGDARLYQTGTVTALNLLAGSNEFRIYDNGVQIVDINKSTGNLTTTGNITLINATVSNQENLAVTIGTEVVATVVIADYDAAFFDFVIKNGTNIRSGTVYAIHDGTNVEYVETSTVDLGNTTDVTLSVDISGADMRLMATTTSSTWEVKSLVRAL